MLSSVSIVYSLTSPYTTQIAENEGAQQQMNMLPATTTEYEGMAQFDSRNFLQVSLLDPNSHYSYQQQTALQLGYTSL